MRRGEAAAASEPEDVDFSMLSPTARGAEGGLGIKTLAKHLAQMRAKANDRAAALMDQDAHALRNQLMLARIERHNTVPHDTQQYASPANQAVNRATQDKGWTFTPQESLDAGHVTLDDLASKGAILGFLSDPGPNDFTAQGKAGQVATAGPPSCQLPGIHHLSTACTEQGDALWHRLLCEQLDGNATDTSGDRRTSCTTEEAAACIDRVHMWAEVARQLAPLDTGK
eukprot:SM000064S19736  [mRNA]  locus=s64:138390:139495:- [translate_table: standard]